MFSGFDLADKIESDIRQTQRRMEQEMNQAMSNAFGMGHHHHHHFHQSHPNPAQREREREERARQRERERELEIQAEREREEELRVERQRERIREQERSREREREREREHQRELERQKIREIERAAARERAIEEEKRRAARERELEIQREKNRLEAQRLAEERERVRIQEERKKKVLQEAEEKMQEGDRLVNFEKHRELISSASAMEFLTLQQNLDGLSPLTEPTERFSKTMQKGLPLEENATIFSAILANEKLTVKNKKHLLTQLCKKLGYQPYAYVALQVPAIDSLLKEENYALLENCYLNNLGNEKLSIDHQYENAIWAHIIRFNPSKCSELFLKLADLIKEERLNVFVETWRNITVIENSVSALDNFYGMIITLYHGKNAEFDELLKKGYLMLTNSNDAKWNHLIAMSKEQQRMVLCENYVASIPNYDAHHEFKHDEKVWEVAASNPVTAKALYGTLKHKNYHHPVLIAYLACWSEGNGANHTIILACYHELLGKYNEKTQLADEKKLWRQLIQSNPDNGKMLYHEFLKFNYNPHHVLSFVDTWMKTINNPAEVKEAYRSNIRNDSLLSEGAKIKKFKPELKALAKHRILELCVTDKAMLEKSIAEWLHSGNGFFPSKPTAGQVYDAKQKKESTVPTLFANRKNIIAKDINKKLAEQNIHKEFKL